MSLFHTLEDGVLNDILHELKLIKGVNGVLMSASVSGDELEPDEIGSLACLIHDSAKNIMQTLDDVESAPAPGKITDTETFKKLEETMENPQPTTQKLSDYTPGLANAKVSIIALWRALDRLGDVANDPDGVGQWITDFHDEIQKCQVA
jgi:hypothetical protein